MMDSFIPQEELRDEISDSNLTEKEILPDKVPSPEMPSEFEDNESAEIKKICGEENVNTELSEVSDPAQPIISLT